MSIRRYSGRLGTFVYDDTMFSLADKEHGNLIYIGDETDGSKITIPFGIVDMSKMFMHSDIVKPPVIPTSVKHMDYAFMNTPLRRMPQIPNGVVSMDYCFADNLQLVSRTMLPLSVQSFECVFDNCPSDYVMIRKNASMRPRRIGMFVTSNRYVNLGRCFARCAAEI